MLASDTILALDIGASSVKIGEFKASKAHGLRLVNFNYADLGLDPEHEENRMSLVESTIRNALREKKIRSSRVVFSVSGQSVFTRFVKLPPVDESKVVQIIQYEAQQNVPFPIDEVIWDYQLLGSTEQGELEVVLLAIKSDIIETLNEGVESAGLRTEIVDVAPMALSNAIRYNESDSEGCTMLVDIGARTTNLLFLEKNRIYSRPIPIAGNAITQAIAQEFNIPFLDAEQLKRSKGFVALGGAYEEPADEQQARVSKVIRNVMTRLHAEMARSINFYKGQQGGTAPQRLLLAGGSSILPYLDRFFEEKMQTSVQLFNPFRNVEISDQVSREELAKCAHFFGEVVGLGLRRVTHCPLEVNLLPRSIRARKQMAQKRPYFIGTALAVLLIPLCLLAYTQKRTTLLKGQLEGAKTEVQHLRGQEAKLKEVHAQLDDVKKNADQMVALWQKRSLWTDLLNDFNQRIVGNIWINTFVPEEAGSAGAASGVTHAIGMHAPPAAAPAVKSGPVTSSTYTEIRIEGGGPRSPDALKIVDAFAVKLRKSPFFDHSAPEEGVVIERPPATMGREPTFSFTIRAKLLKPITD